jgi:hypothetical protein
VDGGHQEEVLESSKEGAQRLGLGFLGSLCVPRGVTPFLLALVCACGGSEPNPSQAPPTRPASAEAIDGGSPPTANGVHEPPVSPSTTVAAQTLPGLPAAQGPAIPPPGPQEVVAQEPAPKPSAARAPRLSEPEPLESLRPPMSAGPAVEPSPGTSREPSVEPSVEPSAESSAAGLPAPERVAPPPPLDSVYTGAAERFQHPRGWYSFEMPRGWTLASQAEDYLVINPGLGPGDTLDSIVMVSHGRLEPEDRNSSVEQLFQKNQPEIGELFTQLQLRMRRPRTGPERVLVGDVPGAQQTWSGRTADGKAVVVWMAGLVKREYFLFVFGLALEDKQELYLPRVKRIFSSLRITPPERNPQLEAALVGRQIANNRTDSSGSTTYIYTFRADRSVHKLSMISFANTGGVGVSGGSSEDIGRFEVIGDEVYLYFGSGQSVGTVVLEGGRLAGVRFGASLYRAR